MSRRFELLLFAVDTPLLAAAVAGGVDGVIVDWERRGKDERQAEADTEINAQTVDDLVRVRRAASCPVVCRLNRWDDGGAEELEAAIAGGADEILLPMVRSTAEVEAALEAADGRCGIGILVETVAALRISRDLARLPLSRVYVGLNDLAIERGSGSIFDALQDGTVERVRWQFEAPFGLGGLTVPDGGSPVPCRYLIAELARLECSFSFLRRSFRRDVDDSGVTAALHDIRTALAAAARRSADQVEDDRAVLLRLLAGMALERELPARAMAGG